jgi:hypothetical protein
LKIRNVIKQSLVKLDLFHPVNLVRELPRILRWMTSGCSGAAPHPIKMMIVRSYLAKYSLQRFIETGTYLGDTLDYVSKSGAYCTSIELSQDLYEAAGRRFNRHKNVTLIQGDSGKELPKLIADIQEPTFFWLDGHYSSGITASAEAATPVSIELNAILNHPVKRHVILIDDVRCFGGENDYPHLDELLRVVRADGCYGVEVSADIIRLTPVRGLTWQGAIADNG